jgi:hypothetical protein
MLTLSGSHSGSVHTVRALLRKRIWLRILVLAGLGAMVLTVLCLFPGCGSDSTPGGAVKGKNAKTAGAEGKKSSAVTSLLTDKEGMDPGAKKMAKQPPDSQQNEVSPPGMTLEELKARTAAQTAAYYNRDPNLIQVAPGMTLKQLQDKTAAQTAHYNRDPNLIQVAPGMTLKQLQDRTAEQAAAYYNRDPNLIQVAPGMTLKQLQDKSAAQTAAYYNRDPNLVEGAPGMTREQEKAKAARE